jgi:hypothetical protein
MLGIVEAPMAVAPAASAMNDRVLLECDPGRHCHRRIRLDSVFLEEIERKDADGPARSEQAPSLADKADVAVHFEVFE